MWWKERCRWQRRLAGSSHVTTGRPAGRRHYRQPCRESVTAGSLLDGLVFSGVDCRRIVKAGHCYLDHFRISRAKVPRRGHVHGIRALCRDCLQNEAGNRSVQKSQSRRLGLCRTRGSARQGTGFARTCLRQLRVRHHSDGHVIKHDVPLAQVLLE